MAKYTGRVDVDLCCYGEDASADLGIDVQEAESNGIPSYAEDVSDHESPADDDSNCSSTTQVYYAIGRDVEAMTFHSRSADSLATDRSRATAPTNNLSSSKLVHENRTSDHHLKQTADYQVGYRNQIHRSVAEEVVDYEDNYPTATLECKDRMLSNSYMTKSKKRARCLLGTLFLLCCALFASLIYALLKDKSNQSDGIDPFQASPAAAIQSNITDEGVVIDSIRLPDELVPSSSAPLSFLPSSPPATTNNNATEDSTILDSVRLPPEGFPSSSPFVFVPHSVAPTQQLDRPSNYFDSWFRPPTSLSEEAPEPSPGGVDTADSFVTFSPNYVANERKCQHNTPPPLPGKKGVAFTLRARGQKGSWDVNLPKVVQLKPHWNYNWGMQRLAAQPSDVEFVPMVWGRANSATLLERIEEHILPYLENGLIQRILGFNEPDKSSQSNIANTSEAFDLWSKLESTNASLVSPSCADSDGDWMSTFMSKASVNCNRVDWAGIHWYGGPNFENFANKMVSLHEEYKVPLLITEMAVADWSAATVADNKHSRSDVLSFMKQALPWLEAQDFIAGYAWFSFDTSNAKGSTSALYEPDGRITTCGQYYASVRNESPTGDQTIGDST